MHDLHKRHYVIASNVCKVTSRGQQFSRWQAAALRPSVKKGLIFTKQCIVFIIKQNEESSSGETVITLLG